MAAPDDVLLATVRDFTDRSGALRVLLLVDRGPDRGAPAVECEPHGPLTISAGEESLEVAPVELIGVEPVHVHLPTTAIPATALEADAATGEVTGPIGGLEALADAVAALAAVAGGRSVAMAEFGTRSGEPLSIAARPGEAGMVAVGEEQFALPERPRET